MGVPDNLERFIKAQEKDFLIALTEIKSGRKRSHWMWYIFPQLQGLGFSSTSQFYAIAGLKEAGAYLQHPVLGTRLIVISKELLQLAENNAYAVFGSPDDLKLKSSMTLFSSVENSDPVFEAVLIKYFKGERDLKTVQLLNAT